jgi:hypothetical protein
MDDDLQYANSLFVKGEAQRLRDGIRKFLAANGNDLCHENRKELAGLLPEQSQLNPTPLPFCRFMWNCLKYRIGLSKRCEGSCHGSKTL